MKKSKPPRGRTLSPRTLHIALAAPLIALGAALFAPSPRAPLAAEGGARAAGAPSSGTRVAATPYRGPGAGKEGWRRLYSFDFGASGEAAVGVGFYDGTRFAPSLYWSEGMVRMVVRPGPDLYVQDFLEGENAVLVLGTDPIAATRVVLTLGDADTARGPIRLDAVDEGAGITVRTGAGSFTDVTFDYPPGAFRHRIRIAARGCDAFAVNGVFVYVPADAPSVRTPVIHRQGRNPPVPGAGGATPPPPPGPRSPATANTS